MFFFVDWNIAANIQLDTGSQVRSMDTLSLHLTADSRLRRGHKYNITVPQEAVSSSYLDYT